MSRRVAITPGSTRAAAASMVWLNVAARIIASMRRL
jgi:hypothetical protein